MTGQEVVPLTALSSSAVESVRAIYEEAFPARQRVAFAEVVELARAGRYATHVAVIGDRPVALAFSSVLASVGWRFLEYLAVDPSLRSRGLGADLWDLVLSGTVRDGLAGMVLEIEDPEEAGLDDGERAQRLRRAAFYERRGVGRLPVDRYRVPNLQGEGSERLILLAAPPRAAKMGAGDMRALVSALYLEGYGVSPLSPLLAEALEVLPAP